jgi:hypothetical protein
MMGREENGSSVFLLLVEITPTACDIQTFYPEGIIIPILIQTKNSSKTKCFGRVAFPVHYMTTVVYIDYRHIIYIRKSLRIQQILINQHVH